MKYEYVLSVLPRNIKGIIKKSNIEFTKLMEIRLRENKPFIIVFDNKEMVYNDYVVTSRDIHELMQYISNYSLYAYENEIREGFITVNGGHRIGLAGKVVIEKGEVKLISSVGSVNIRIAHEIRGCSDKIMGYLYKDEGQGIHNTLIVAPPFCGKTTLLRDIIRNISNGFEKFSGRNVGVVDERGEIAACYKGIPMNDIGIRTDVLDGCSKEEGIYMLLRAMAPSVIAIDEIGGRKDLEILRYCINCGCSLIATIHGYDIELAKNRNQIVREIIDEKIFTRMIILSNREGVGSVEKILDGEVKAL